MTTKFLPRDPDKALSEVKEMLYDRLKVLRSCLVNAVRDEYGYLDDYDNAMSNEIKFIEELLDIIERS